MLTWRARGKAGDPTPPATQTRTTPVVCFEMSCRTADRNVPQRRYALDNPRLPNKTPILGLGCSSFSSFFTSHGDDLTANTLSKDHPVVRGWVDTIR
jgi:hypothetical protein